MVGINRIEELVSRERKIFRFLVFYLLLGVFLVLLFINSGGWTFIQTAIIVFVTEIVVTNLVTRGKPIHTNQEVMKELDKIKEIDEYTKLRDEYMDNKDNTITIALTVYSLGVIVFLFLTNFNLTYLILAVTGFMILYFSVYLFFRYKINKVTIILLQRSRVIKEMKMDKKKREEEERKRRERSKRLRKLRKLTQLRKKKAKNKSKKKKTKRKRSRK